MTPEEIRAWTAKMEARRDELILLIEQAFDGVSREGGVSLSEAYVIDDRGDEIERAEARLEDTDTRWQDVDLSGFHALDIPMFFMDTIGFRYYLPVFLIAELKSIVAFPPSERDPEGCIAWGHGEGLSFYVTHTLHSVRPEQYVLLNATQRSVIRQVLQFFADYGGDEAVTEPLERYWCQFV